MVSEPGKLKGEINRLKEMPGNHRFRSGSCSREAHFRMDCSGGCSIKDRESPGFFLRLIPRLFFYVSLLLFWFSFVIQLFLLEFSGKKVISCFSSLMLASVPVIFGFTIWSYMLQQRFFQCKGFLLPESTGFYFLKYLVENTSPVQFYTGLESFLAANFFLREKIFNELI